ncbi:MAG TPA: hypothetical protein VKN99_10635 [Polyangia bacterium]|nr:hypothetical protein [Polyangia bacterium]
MEARPEVGQLVRLRGVVRGRGGEGGFVAASAFLHIADEKPVHKQIAERFDLVPEDGAIVSVTMPVAPQLLVPERVRTGRWEEVESDALAALFRAPAPFVAVKLGGAAIASGETIELLGRVVETAAVEPEGGLRGPVTSRIAGVEALALATGPEASAALDRAQIEIEKKLAAELRAARRKQRVVGHWAWIGLAGLLLLSSFHPAWRGTPALRATTVLGFLCVAVWWRPRRLARVHRSEDPGFGRRRVDFADPLLPVAAGLFLLWHFSCFGSPPHPFVSLTADYIWLIWAGYFAVLTFWRQRGLVRLRSILAAAPSHPAGISSSVWGLSVGTVKGGRMDSILDTPTLDLHGTFTVETEAGVVEVDPSKNTLWASTTRRGEVTGTSWWEYDLIPPGASIAVAGRLRREQEGAPGRIEPYGPDSVILFATSPRGDPVPTLKRQAWLYQAAVVVSLILLAQVALSVAVSRGLIHF